jgi:hypothetical protein
MQRLQPNPTQTMEQLHIFLAGRPNTSHKDVRLQDNHNGYIEYITFQGFLLAYACMHACKLLVVVMENHSHAGGIY